MKFQVDETNKERDILRTRIGDADADADAGRGTRDADADTADESNTYMSIFFQKRRHKKWFYNKSMLLYAD